MIGLPKWRASVAVLLPPCVMTTSTAGRIDGCGGTPRRHVVGQLVLGVLRTVETVTRYGVLRE